MGFWDTVGKGIVSIAKEGNKQLTNMSNNIKETEMRLQSKSPEELKRICKSNWSTSTEKMVAASLLKRLHGKTREYLED